MCFVKNEHAESKPQSLEGRFREEAQTARPQVLGRLYL